MNMTEYLIDAGFNFVWEGNGKVIVQDPRWQNYRVYNTEETNLDWIEAFHHTYDWVDEATRFALEK